MQPSKTLVVVASTLPVGGTERVLETLARGLPDYGIEVRLLCLREFGEVGCAIVEHTMGPHREGIAPARFSFGQIGRVARALEEARPDAVLVLDHANALLYGGLAARRAGLRATFTPIHSTGKPDGSPSLGRVDRWTIRLSQRVVALSPRHAAYVTGALGVPADRVEIIPNGVDVERFGPDGPVAADLPVPFADGRLRLGVLAALRPEKNHAFLLETLASIEAARRPHLVVIGDGPLRGELEARANSLGLEHQVSWLGTRHDVPEILRGLDAVVLPSRNTVETFPVSVLEAMACGVAPVVADVGAVRDMVEDGVHGRVFPSGDGAALCEALEELRSDPARRRALGEAGRARVRAEFTREQMIERYAALVERLAAARAVS